MILTAEELYNKLLNEYDIKSVNGYIKFNLGQHEMIVNTKDVVGNIIENWVKDWMFDNDIEFESNPNTQTKPDVYLIPDDHSKGLLEIKAFDYTKSANFDIADFKGFANEVIQRPFLIDLDALIFGYKMDSNTGKVNIEDIWLKKIWEISCPSDRFPIKVQCKRDVISKIRPATWYSSTGRTKYKTFQSREDFLAAFEETLYQYHDTHSMASDWKKRFLDAYYIRYGERMDFPRWNDIKVKYGFAE